LKFAKLKLINQITSKFTGMVVIYRLQDINSNGPYSKILKNNEKLHNELCAARYKNDRPGNLEDGSERYMHPDADTGTPLARAYFNKLIYPGSEYIFGFAKIEHLYIWFAKEEIDIYKNYGIYIYEFTIPDDKVIYGSRQVIFKLSDTISQQKYHDI
jgi:hypothetical protein